MSRMVPVIVVLSLGLGLVAVAPAQAGGFGIPDIGVRRTGMGAVIGRPDEASALYHNPAGMALRGGWHLYLSTGLFVVRTEFQLQPWGDSDRFLGTTAGADGYYAPARPTRAMGAVPMLAAAGEVIPGRLYAGAALYVGNGQGAGFDANGVTRYHLIDGYIIAPQAVLAVSYRLSDALAIGGSAGVLNLRVHGRREVYPVIDGTDISNLAGTRPELVLDGTGWAPTWMLAAFGRPHPRVTWGATVTGRVDATLEGPVEITYSDDAPSPGDMLIGRQRTKQFLPWAFMGGVNVDVTPNIEIGAELRYWLYRQYKTHRVEVTGIFLVRELVTQKNYRDSWQLSGGVRVHDLPQLPGLELMTGLHSDHTPAPSTTVTFDQPTFDHLGLHTGARWSIDRYRVGASYLRYWYDIPTVMDSTTGPPSNFRGTGANHVFTLSIEATL